MSDATTAAANITAANVTVTAGNTTAAAGGAAAPTGPLAWESHVIDYAISHAAGLITGFIVLILGALVAKALGRVLDSWLKGKVLEPPLRVLLVRLARLIILGMAVAVALGTAGMDVTALIAGLSVAGVGIGLAMQGVLGNLVAGMTIIFTKPFRVGEYIEILGVEGQVHTIELLSTILTHPDRSLVKIPNRKIIGEVLHNYGSMRRLSLSVGVAYDTDIRMAIELAQNVLRANPRVLKDPAPWVGVTGLGDSSVTILAMPWTQVLDYGTAQAEILQALLEAYRAKGISIPFPQREVRMLGPG